MSDKLAIELQIERVKEQRRVSIEYTEKYQGQNTTLKNELANLENALRQLEVKDESFKKGDAVICGMNKVQIIESIEEDTVNYKSDDNKQYWEYKEGIKRKATLKDLQDEIKRMFEKCEQYSYLENKYIYWQDLIFKSHSTLVRVGVPKVNSYNGLLNFITNAKPITDEQPEQDAIKNKTYPFCCIEKCEKFDGTIKNNCKKYSNIFNCKYHTKTYFEIEPEQEFEEFYDHDNESHRVKKLIKNQKLIINRLLKK